MLSRKPTAAPEQKDEKRGVRLGYPSVLDGGFNDVTPCADGGNSVINRRCRSQRSHHDVPGQAQNGGTGISPLHLQPDARRTWVLSTTLWPVLSKGKTRCPLYRTVGEPRDRFVRHEISNPHQHSIPGPSGFLRVAVLSVLRAAFINLTLRRLMSYIYMEHHS